MAADTCYYHFILFSQHPHSNSLHGHNNLNSTEDSLHPVTTCDEVEGEASSCMLSMHPESNIRCLPAKSSSMEESYKSEEESELRPTREITVSFTAIDEGTRSNRRAFTSLSCRSFEDLEMEEAKGFMDLGFIFAKEQLNRQTMSVILGLQGLVLVADGNHREGDEKGNPVIEGGRIGPYLSEAWLVRGPDSPLLNLWGPEKG